MLGTHPVFDLNSSFTQTWAIEDPNLDVNVFHVSNRIIVAESTVARLVASYGVTLHYEVTWTNKNPADPGVSKDIDMYLYRDWPGQAAISVFNSDYFLGFSLPTSGSASGVTYHKTTFHDGLEDLTGPGGGLRAAWIQKLAVDGKMRLLFDVKAYLWRMENRKRA